MKNKIQSINKPAKTIKMNPTPKAFAKTKLNGRIDREHGILEFSFERLKFILR